MAVIILRTPKINRFFSCRLLAKVHLEEEQRIVIMSDGDDDVAKEMLVLQ